jgi:RNA polymerase sigma-70 factor (ECF subfamily)
VTENEQRHVFEEWLSQYKGLFFKIVRAYAFTPTDQDDLFQEIAMQVWYSVPAFRRESSASTWIYRISINTAIKWVQKERKHSMSEGIDEVQHVLQDNRMQADERLAWLYEEIHQLNEIDRSIALLLLDGFSYKEMAAILGITESNVGVKINRIKKQLIAKSKKYDYHGI